MLVRFWGTRGSLPVALGAEAVADRIAAALLAADGRRFADRAEARAYVDARRDFADRATYGGATSCVEIDGADDGRFLVCDMGSGLREFGLRAAALSAAGTRPKTYDIFLSHLHWDHIMGFPFFVPAFDPGARIVFHGGHAEMEAALRRQQEPVSFPVAFDWLRADISFDVIAPGERRTIAGVEVSLIRQRHSNDSYGFRFDHADGSVVYSTDSEYKDGDVAAEARAEDFFRGADLVIFDTMYSLADSVTMKEDWGHSSNIVGVDLCRGAGAKRIALFHHEPTCGDAAIERMFRETVRYEELSRDDGTPLEVVCAYDGLELTV